MPNEAPRAKGERAEKVEIKGLEHRDTYIQLVPKRGNRLTVAKRPPDKK